MEKLFELSAIRISRKMPDFKRYLYGKISWNQKMISIRGARGTGKTTMLLQYIQSSLPKDHRTLFISVDDLYFGGNTLVGLADQFVKLGGKYLVLDEVHKYPGWSTELKNIYDRYAELQVIFSGSSVLDIHKGEADLSRRVLGYYLKELSFREYLTVTGKTQSPAFSLPEILKNHTAISMELVKQFKPILELRNYMRFGSYPYFLENEPDYPVRLKSVINLVIENDLAMVHNLDSHSISAIKRVLYAIATSVPFKPNITKLSERTGITRSTLMLYLQYLEKAEIIKQLFSEKTGVSSLGKPEKIYLNNPNLLNVLGEDNVNPGNLRETFFISQFYFIHKIQYTDYADFLVDNKFLFEVGGKNKSRKQILEYPNGRVVKDDLEVGIDNIIPLWLMGFIY